jgi:mRNA interferase MazF
MQADDVVLASFPFGDTSGMKLRPVLLLTGPLGDVPEILVAYISSVLPATLLATDILLDPSLPRSTRGSGNYCRFKWGGADSSQATHRS